MRSLLKPTDFTVNFNMKNLASLMKNSGSPVNSSGLQPKFEFFNENLWVSDKNLVASNILGFPMMLHWGIVKEGLSDFTPMIMLS